MEIWNVKKTYQMTKSFKIDLIVWKSILAKANMHTFVWV